jgi:hypothetical protein
MEDEEKKKWGNKICNSNKGRQGERSDEAEEKLTALVRNSASLPEDT